VRYASAPADDDHRFGHGKAEAIAALLQGGLTAASAMFLGWMSLDRLFHLKPLKSANEPVAISLLAIATTLILVFVQRRVIRSTGSVAVEADHAHYQGDVLLNASVIAAVVLETFVKLRGADSLFGIAIAFVILYNGYTAAGRAWDMLMDRVWPVGEQEQLRAAILAHQGIMDVHELRTRTSGIDRFADFHIAIDGNATVREADKMAHALEEKLAALFPHTQFLIHVDPDVPDHS
jgi:ferrous-iron efflux pump FieF